MAVQQKTATDRLDLLEAKLDALLTAILHKQETEKESVEETREAIDLGAWTDAQWRSEARKVNLLVPQKGVLSSVWKSKISEVMAGDTHSGIVKAQEIKQQQEIKSAPSLSVVNGRKPLPTISAAARDGVAINSKDAAEALRTHPLNQNVLLVSREQWQGIRSMGAEVKKNGKGTGEYNDNPANLSRRDRQLAHMLSLKPGTNAKEWTLYQGCLILEKLQAAGYNV